MKNNKFELIEMYDDLIKKSELSSAIDLAVELGTLLWSNDLGIFSLPKIEKSIIDRVAYEIKIDTLKNQLDFDYLFLASEIYLTGGHSRLIENVSSFLEEENVDLIITNKVECEVLERAKKFFNKIELFGNNNFSNFKKIKELSTSIAKYNNIILSIHPNDIITVISCAIAKRKNRDLKIYFINHSDHTFSFGTTISDVWFEISLYGTQIDLYRNLNGNKSFLGIPVNDNTYEPINRKFTDGDLILSAGAFNKYRPIDGNSLFPLIDTILSKYKKSKFLVIGVRKYRDYWWWHLKIKYWNRLVLKSKLNYDDYLKATQNARLYIDSHPFPGGTAFVEQFLNGRKLCTGLLTSYKGYTPLEKHKREDVQSVINFIEDINLEEYRSIITDIYNVHSYGNVKNRFLNSLKGEYCTYPDKTYFSPNYKIKYSDKIFFIPNSLSFKNYKIVKHVFHMSTLITVLKFLAKKLIYTCGKYKKTLN